MTRTGAALLALVCAVAGLGPAVAASGADTASDTYAVGDLVWADTDADGVRDPGEPGVADVRVVVRDGGGTVVGDVVTGTDGSWTVDDLEPGIYTAQFTRLPRGSTFTQPGHGSVFTDSDVDPRTGTTLPFLLGPGASGVRHAWLADGVAADQIDASVDAGLVTPTFALHDRAWHDTDLDGVADPGEPPAPGIRVDAVSADGTQVAHGTTDARGDVLLTGLPSGRYTLEYSGLPRGAGFTHPSVSTGGSSVPLGSSSTSPFVLSPVEYGVREVTPSDRADGITDSYIADNFGVGLVDDSYAIGNQVWHDDDGDGRREDGEPGVAGVKVTLVWHAHAQASTTTDGRGVYVFDRLPRGGYSVVFTAPRGQTFTTPGIGSSGIDSDVNADGHTAVIELTRSAPDVRRADAASRAGGIQASRVNTTVDAGLVGRTFALGDTVWRDLDGDGVRDPGEAGAPGVQVQLLDDQGVPVSTTISDGVGHWVFDGLAAGIYSVRVIDLGAGLGFSPAGRGTAATDSDVDPRTGVSLPIRLDTTARVVRPVRPEDAVTASFVDLSVDIGVVE